MPWRARGRRRRAHRRVLRPLTPLRRRSFRPRRSALHRVIEHDAEAGRFVTFAHSRRARDTIAAVRRMAASGSRTCQPARPASRTTLLSAGSSPSQYLVGCAGVQPARARMQRANGIGARRKPTMIISPDHLLGPADIAGPVSDSPAPSRNYKRIYADVSQPPATWAATLYFRALALEWFDAANTR